MRREFEDDEPTPRKEANFKTLHSKETTVELKFPSLWNVTFPGVVIHELTHYFLILITGGKIVGASLFGAKQASVTFKPNSLFPLILISTAPMLIGTIIAIAFFDQFFNALGNPDVLMATFWLWLGFSTAMHANPSVPDLKIAEKSIDALWKTSKPLDAIIALILYVPIAYPLLFFAQLREKTFNGAQGDYAWTILLLILTAGIQQYI